MNGEPIKVVNEPPEIDGFAPTDLYQKREKIFTRHVGGRFQRLRFYTGWPLLTGYFMVPWLSWNGRQAVLFDLPARQFHIGGLTFWPQDFWLLGWLLIIAAFGLFTVTNAIGRLWCGYTCPQTVWTAIFMWIEQVTEGPRHARIRLDQAPWTAAKFAKRGSKHAMWLTVAALTGMTFVGYFVPVRELATDLWNFSAGGWAVFWIAFFAAATYVNAGWLREQVCIYMCPYARFQSAMFDQNTLIVSYNPNRGEPRGSRKRGNRAETAPAVALGDCIDCKLCVQVCPTGIDIRDGLQYECIGCAHCVDACNQVMDKMGYPHDLISYTTERALQGLEAKRFRPRTFGYAAALAVMSAVFVYALTSRVPFEIDVLRGRDALFQERAGQVVNDYQLKLINKSQQVMRVALEVDSDTPLALAPEVEDSVVTIDPGEVLDLPIRLSVENTALASAVVPVTISACVVDSPICDSEETVFLGPAQ